MDLIHRRRRWTVNTDTAVARRTLCQRIFGRSPNEVQAWTDPLLRHRMSLRPVPICRRSCWSWADACPWILRRLGGRYPCPVAFIFRSRVFGATRNPKKGARPGICHRRADARIGGISRQHLSTGRLHAQHDNDSDQEEATHMKPPDQCAA
jgi:hypothetical protein